MSVLCRGFFEKLVTLKWGGGLENADVIRGGGGRSMLTVADRGEGVKFAKILLTSYVNAPLQICSLEFLSI